MCVETVRPTSDPVSRSPSLEEIGVRTLINSYSSEALHRWQKSIVGKLSPEAVLCDSGIGLYQKLYQSFYMRKNRVFKLNDLIRMSDRTLEKIIDSPTREEEMVKVRQSMVRHNVLPLNSRVVFEIDLLGLPEPVREILVNHNIKTIESICQMLKNGPQLNEGVIGKLRGLIENHLLKFIEGLTEWEKTTLEEKTNQKQTTKEPKQGDKRDKRRVILEKYGSKDNDGKTIESWNSLLIKLCGDLPLREVAGSLGVIFPTLIRWRKEAGLPRRSIVETKKINSEKLSPEEKLKRKKEKRRKKIIKKLKAIDGVGEDPIYYIKQQLKNDTPENLFYSLREKGLEIENSYTFYQWLRSLGLRKAAIYQEESIYQEAKQKDLLIRLTKDQQINLEMVFGQNLTLTEAARRLSLEKNRKVLRESVRYSIIGAINKLKKLESSP